MSDDWQKQVDWMRKNGVLSAKWSDTGGGKSMTGLVECILGPLPDDVLRETPEEMKSRHEREAKEREDKFDFLDTGAG